jgi:hypothetical protein
MDNTDKIEIGNYVFDNDGTIIEFGTRVKDIALNIGVFLSQYPKENSASIPVTFVDHKGLLGFDNATSYTSGGYSLTNVDPSVIADLKLGDVVINSHTPQYTVVTRISGTTVTVSNPFSGNGTNVRSFFYRAKGLYNDSLAAYSTGVFAAPTVSTSTSGSNTLTVAYTDSIVNGMVVQFGNKIAAGTTVSAINQTTKVITLSGASPITETIPPGQLIVFAPAGTTDNKEICFTPLDISPPFIATESGMQSTVERPNLEIKPDGGVAGELKFVGLSALGVTVAAVPNTPAPTYNTTLLIKDATGTSYNILATT